MRENRLSYNNPSRYITGGVQVCVCFVSAGFTPELLLCWAIGFTDKTALITALRCISRIDDENLNSRTLSLVFDVRSKLPKRPVMQALPLAFVGLNPGTNMLEFFKRYSALGAFSLSNDCLGNRVIGNSLETPLPARQAFEPAFRGFGSAPLQTLAMRCTTGAQGFYLRATKLFARAIGRDVDDTHIDAQHACRRNWFGFDPSPA